MLIGAMVQDKIQNDGNIPLLCLPDQSIPDGGIESRLQKFPAGQNLLPGITGVQGMLLLYRQKLLQYLLYQLYPF